MKPGQTMAELDAENEALHAAMRTSQEMHAKAAARVRLLEDGIRKVYADEAGEFDPADIEKLFGCYECLDTGVVGGNPKGDENDSCCARCDRGGNPMAYPKPSPLPEGFRLGASLSMVDDGKPFAPGYNVMPCGERDQFSPRRCTLPKGHDGEHKDTNFKARWIDTDKGWP